ncbi:hypothetical protein SAMN05428970_1550 [Agromyces sp. CF514]|uniref:hypothetical protein n=1 Tax=Agromyces sp. CF514 TaxID=1881031 RepID=UPI0008E26981|nr:hypothetical protein [Agromyces sp. CF514]SFR73444.1 hypothetical protein SAMN05428970_1550 [Agromyces sp. CF514]
MDTSSSTPSYTPSNPPTNPPSNEELEAFIEQTAEAKAPPTAASAKDARERADADRESAWLARSVLAKGGTDADALDALAEHRSGERRTRAAAGHRAAVEASTRIGAHLAELTPVLPVDPGSQNVILDRPTFIRTFAGAGSLADSSIGSLDSWARYRFDASAGAVTETGTGRLSFFTLWQNPRSTPAVVNAGARLVVNADVSADADWNGVAAWFISGSEARATVRARTTVWSVANSAVNGIVHDEILADVGAAGDFFGDDDATSIAFNEFLVASAFPVGANEFILIEVEVLTEFVATSGSVSFDGASGDFLVSLPHLILTLS